MKSIFPAAIDSNLLKLVHLLNSFRMVNGAKPLQVGDICRSEARIVSVTNSSEGKIAKVKGHCYRNNQPVIEVISSFLYRGSFVDYKNTFDMSSSLSAGTPLIFRIQSQVSFKDKTTYRNVSVSGDIFVQNQLKVLIKVGSVDFQQDRNPVLAYLQRHGTPQGLTTPLANSYSLNTPDVSTTFNTPTNCTQKYLEISIPFTLTLTSPILHLSLLLSLMECGQVPQPAAMLKVL